MALSLFSLLLLLRRRRFRKPPPFSPAASQSHHLSTTARRPLSTAPLSDSPDPHKPPNLSARLSFVFDQIDAIDRDRSAKDAALQRIRAWRQSQQPQTPFSPATDREALSAPSPGEAGGAVEGKGEEDVFKKEVELVHPWPEWIELMERLAQQNYFDHRRVDEDRVAQNVPIDLSGISDETGFDFARDWTTVRTACMNFGRDRFDILRSLARKDLQILVGHGCPSMDSKVVFSAKLLRKYVHLDEGDVCSSCSLRNSCGRGYILTHKEDEARTLDVMRILLTFGFDHVLGSVENKPLMKMKSVKTVVRKLLHEVVKLGAVPIDPSLPPPVIKKAPPKVKQPPPPPKKRVGRDDVEMKKGDWLCIKCDFMNFAKNTVCLQCDALRPKRQLLPGEWECPQCNFLNYRRNMACFHCDHKRPPDEFMENQMQGNQSGLRTRSERAARTTDVSTAWNFDFDDNESDGADVAAFEFADSPKMRDDPSLNSRPRGRIASGFEDDTGYNGKVPRTHERSRYFNEPDERKSTSRSDRAGFDDFDDEEDDNVDSYELEEPRNSKAREVSRKNFSEVEQTSDSEDSDDSDRHINSDRGRKYPLSGSDDDDLVDHPNWKPSHAADSRQKSGMRGGPYPRRGMPSDEDIELDSDSDDDMDGGFNSKHRKSRQQTGRKGIGQERNFDSESDDDDFRHPSGKMMRGNKGISGGRTNAFGKLDQSGSGRRREFRSDDRASNRRNSFGNGMDNSSSRGSRRFERGSRGGGRGGWRENDRFERYDKVDDREGSDRRQRGRANQFNGRSNGSRRNERGSLGGYGARRRDDGIGPRASDYRQQGRSNRFADRSRSFDDDDGDERPRRRIIER